MKLPKRGSSYCFSPLSIPVVRHWTHENRQGYCTFPICQLNAQVETIEHMLLSCPAYSSTRKNLIALCARLRHPVSNSLVIRFLLGNSSQDLLQLLLDCSIIPQVITSAQHYGEIIYSDLYYIGRTWCFSIHRERLKRLHRWNFR